MGFIGVKSWVGQEVRLGFFLGQPSRIFFFFFNGSSYFRKHVGASCHLTREDEGQSVVETGLRSHSTGSPARTTLLLPLAL